MTSVSCCEPRTALRPRCASWTGDYHRDQDKGQGQACSSALQSVAREEGAAGRRWG